MDIAFAIARAKGGLFAELIAFCSLMAIATNGWRDGCAIERPEPTPVRERGVVF
jgi:hypothetical protein